MVGLAARLLDAPMRVVDEVRVSPRMLLFPFLRRRQVAEKPDLLVIAARPRQLMMLSDLPDWRSGYNRIFGWIMDSFWTDRIPAEAIRGKFDRLFITTLNDVDEYRRRTGVDTEFLGIGADALGIGRLANKDVDLLRLGRQPAAWDDDEANDRLLAEAGLSYRGRPPFHDDPVRNLTCNAAQIARARFVMAHTNLADQADYTHRDKEYMTCRWADALAGGAVVAGRAPQSDGAIGALLWPGALVDVSPGDQATGLMQLRAAVAEWTPAQAAENRRLALLRLDWRWRLSRIASLLGHYCPQLETELRRIRQLAEALESRPALARAG